MTKKLISRAGVMFAIMASALVADGMAMAASVVYPSERQPGSARFAELASGAFMTLKNDLFETHFQNLGGKLYFGGADALGLQAATELFSIKLQGRDEPVKASDMKVTSWRHETLPADSLSVVDSGKYPGEAVCATLEWEGMTFNWRAVLRDGSHYIRTELDVTSDHDVAMESVTPMLYHCQSAQMPAVVGNTRGAIVASPVIFAGLETPTGINTVDSIAPGQSRLKGMWSRHTTLKAGDTWSVSAVVGAIAPDQPRRSVLAYSERERAVPWRPFPLYNSWYELNIDRNNSPDYDGHMTAQECESVVRQWHDKLFSAHGVNVKSFVWDDGWDEYGTWKFNKNFPNGFDEPYACAKAMDAGTGTWLGPVGGYGQSGDMRRAYWADNGGMQLSNPAYHKVFLDACSDMVKRYNFNFFKLDGLSAQFSSVGPDEGYVGEENVEGIINVLQQVRSIRPDMFFNTTVGTWASPFWFHFTDAVWRQEADHATLGNQGDDRERWITYRDHLVYQNFVKNSPLCPINSLMTHGVILTDKGDVSKTMDYDGIVREIRCAFACGSAMVELYCDSHLLNTIRDGALWKDIADCIKWQERNAQVLPDTHWVGGDPWDGENANVYGWGAWNGDRMTLTLRNPSESAQTFTFTLSEALELPDYYTSNIKIGRSFDDQPELEGLDTGTAIAKSEVISVTLPPNSVYVFEGEAQQ